ncbi:MAG: redoxin family protein [Bacteroidetes bacterium]|nr:redoxin family protein [Bacteroidota bacterium]
MKRQIWFFAICLFSTAMTGQTMFSGQLKHGQSAVVLVEKPFDGKYLPQPAEPVLVDKNGKFEIKVNENLPGFLILHINGNKIRVFLEPNAENDAMVADLDKWESSVRFTGPNAAQNEFLQSLQRITVPTGKHLFQMANPFFKKGATPKETYLEVTDYREAEKKLLKKAAKNDFSKPFKDAVENDIQMYYSSIFGSVAYRQWLAARKNSPYVFDAGWSNYWKKMTTQDCLDNLPAAVSEWYLTFVEQYIREYRLDFLQESEFADADTLKGEQFLEYDRLIWKYLKPDVQEYVSAGIYAAAATDGQVEPILKDLKDKFKNDFPQSRYNPVLESLLGEESFISTAQNSGASSTQNLGPDIHLLGLDTEINSLQVLLAPFKGKVVYMDIWATWCTPCMFEFGHHEPVDQFVKGKDIVLLYVSVDDESRSEKWQKVIKDKNLKGYHMMVNVALRDELIQRFGDGENLALPTYLIFDKKGKLAVKDAKQPSHEQLLFDQLSQYLK